MPVVNGDSIRPAALLYPTLDQGHVRRPRLPGRRLTPPDSLGTMPSLAEIAQLVEHATENRGVASSILALGTEGSGLAAGRGAHSCAPACLEKPVRDSDSRQRRSR